MVPHMATKVKKAAEELTQFIDANKDTLGGTEQLTKAEEELQAANAVVEAA